MNNFMGHLTLLFAACVRICTRHFNKNLICRPKIIHLHVGRGGLLRRFHNHFIYNFKAVHSYANRLTLLFAACVRFGTCRLNKNLICCPVSTGTRRWAGAIGLALAAIVFFSPMLVQAGVNVSFSPDKIGMNETAELIFSSDEPIKTAPDMNEIALHFRVSGQQMQEMTSIVNGQLARSYQLVFNVRPLKIGKVVLDNLTLNGQKLNAVTLDVVNTNTFAGAPVTSVKLQADVQKKQIYVGESFVYKLILYDASKIIDGQLYPPRPHDVDLRPIGKDKVYRGVKDGKTVEIVERSFLVTPKSAGTLVFDPAVFEGTSRETLRAKRMPGELFDMGILFDGMANFGAPITVHSDSVQVQVLPKPASWNGWWLPSSEVTLTQSFKMPEKIVVGEPIERTLILNAVGVEGEKLPELNQPAGSGFKIYPSVPQRRTDESVDGVSGMQELTIVLIPTVSGTQTIPAIEVPWFDTKTGQKKIAKVPARTIVVEAAAGESGTNVKPNESSGQGKLPLGVNESVTATPSAQTQSFEPMQSRDQMQSPITMATNEKAALAPAVNTEERTPRENKHQVNDWVLILAGFLIGMSMAGLIMYFYVKRREAKKKKPLPDLYPF